MARLDSPCRLQHAAKKGETVALLMFRPES